MRIEKYRENMVFSYYELNGQVIVLPKNKKMNIYLKKDNIKEVEMELNKTFLKANKAKIISICITGVCAALMLISRMPIFQALSINVGLISSLVAMASLVPTGINVVKSGMLRDAKKIVDEELIIDLERKNKISVVKKNENSDNIGNDKEKSSKLMTNSEQTKYKYGYSNQEKKYENKEDNIIYPNFGGNSKKHK